MKFDRRASPALIAAIVEGGPPHALVELVLGDGGVLDVRTAMVKVCDRFVHLDTTTLVAPAAPTDGEFNQRYEHTAQLPNR